MEFQNDADFIAPSLHLEHVKVISYCHSRKNTGQFIISYWIYHRIIVTDWSNR